MRRYIKHSGQCFIGYPNTSKIRQKYSAARRIFNCLLGVWISRWNTVSRVWYTVNLRLQRSLESNAKKSLPLAKRAVTIGHLRVLGSNILAFQNHETAAVSVYHTGPLIAMCWVDSFIHYRHEMTLTCLTLVGWSGCGPTSEEFEPKCQVVPMERLDTWLFQVWRRNISIPKNQCIPCGNTWHFRFKFHIPPRQGSNSPPLGGLCVSNSLLSRHRRKPNTRGLSGLRKVGGGSGGQVGCYEASNRWAHYCAHCSTLWLFQVMQKILDVLNNSNS